MDVLFFTYNKVVKIMHQEDLALYSAMQTLLLRQQLASKRMCFRHDAEYARYVHSEFKRLHKQGSLQKSTLKYFYDAILPKNTGFQQRWQRHLECYRQIHQNLARHQQLNDLQRLQQVLHDLEASGFATGMRHPEELVFNKEQSAKVLEFGYVGLAIAEAEKFSAGQMQGTVYLTYYIGEKRAEAEYTLVRTLQYFGFNFYFEQGQQRQELAHKAFDVVILLNFAPALLGSTASPP